jgi:FkbM family methyltransferase
MSTNWPKYFFRDLSLVQKVKFVLTKTLRRIVNDIGKKKHFDSLYEFYLLCKLSGASVSVEKEGYKISHLDRTYFLRKNSSDIDVFIQVILKNEYKFIVDFIKRNKISLETMIDAGANIGLTSLLFGYNFPGIKILAIEPDAGNFKQLKQNIENINELSIEIVNGGLAPYMSWLTPVESFLDNREWSRSFNISEEKNDGICIKGYSVDDLLAISGWEQIDFLKMDIEGGEKNIFVPGSTFYSFLKVVNIIAIEIHDTGELRQEIYTILSDYDYFVIDQGELTIGIKKELG